MDNQQFVEELKRKTESKEIIFGFSLIKDNQGELQMGILVGLFKSEREMDTKNLSGTFIPISTIDKIIDKTKKESKEVFVITSPNNKEKFLVFEHYKKENQDVMEKLKERLNKEKNDVS